MASRGWRCSLAAPTEPLKGLGEMTLVGLLSERVAPGLKFTFEDTSKIIDGSSCCSNMFLNLPDVKMATESIGDHELRIKKVMWVDGLPFCSGSETGEIVKMNCLHFQGESKLVIGCFFDSYMKFLRQAAFDTKSECSSDSVVFLQEAFKSSAARSPGQIKDPAQAV